MSINLNISDQINHQYRTYALYVLQSRGIPNFYDALTPVQRLILENSPGKFNKTIGLVGEVIKTGLYHHGDCFLYNTKINLADGTQVSIGDWAEKFPDIKLFVYCVDENGEKTISLGHSPRVGQITDEMFEIELENGEIFKCTKNHPFLTNRGWIKAEDLLGSDEIVSI
jgi:DNA gyrase subunit A